MAFADSPRALGRSIWLRHRHLPLYSPRPHCAPASYGPAPLSEKGRTKRLMSHCAHLSVHNFGPQGGRASGAVCGAGEEKWKGGEGL